VLHLRGAGDEQDIGRVVQQPAQGNLLRGGAVLLGKLVEGSQGFGVTAGQREPRNEGHILRAGVVEHRFPLAVIDTIHVLHRHDFDVSLGLFNLIHVHFRQADVLDEAVLLGFLQEFQRVLERHLGVDAVQLVEVNLIELEAFEAAVQHFLQVLGAGINGPHVGPGAQQPALGADDQALFVRVQRLGNQFFRHVGAVAVGGVDEVNAQLHGRPQHADGLVVVGRGPPNAFAGDAHGPVAEAVHGEVAADGERGGVSGCGGSCHWLKLLKMNFTDWVKTFSKTILGRYCFTSAVLRAGAAGAAAHYFWSCPFWYKKMNEQLIVKNFGPIKDATVDFKRVTVFIGPTGGGKSTLAKLAVIMRHNFLAADMGTRARLFKDFSLNNYFQKSSLFNWVNHNSEAWEKSFATHHDLRQFESTVTEGSIISNSVAEIQPLQRKNIKRGVILANDLLILQDKIVNHPKTAEALSPQLLEAIERMSRLVNSSLALGGYFPSNRALVSAVEYSWAGLLRDDIGLPKDVLDFANDFSLSRKDVSELDIPFLNVKYIHQSGQDFIKIPENETLFRLYETASGIQSVTPLLVLLEHLSRNTEQVQSFIIEEPELNLYPTAQQGLLNWLVEKCTKGENDLTITTHSPYILSHLNLLLYAHQVAEQHPERAEEVDKIVPRASWINPAEFACYQVEGGGVSSLVNAELGLIDDNGLDNLSGDAADAFDNLIRLSKAVALK